ncbi:MAG: beta-galactosidase [Chloroflexi bacterium]|nr:beta-galactosidase [Chloroflexota bacterium]
MKARLFRLFLMIVVLGSLAALSLTVASWVESKTPAPEPLPPRVIPDTDVNPYGANFFLDREVEEWKRDRTVRMAREAGIIWAKQQFSWEEIEKRKNQFDWDKSDQMIATFEKYGLQIIARLDRPPAWSHKDKSIPQAPPDDLNDYGDFVDAFVRRYRGRVNYIQIWNEPNIFPEWGNRPVDPWGYAELLRVAYARAKAANPNVRVLSAPLAITLGEGWSADSPYWRNMNDLDYLRSMYAAGAKDNFDILSANAFGLKSTPDDSPDPNRLNFQRVVLARQIMEENGDAYKAVWINEYGWNAAPADFPNDKLIWGRVPEQQQADYTVRGITQARTDWQWVGVFNIWYFRQVGDITPDRADYYFRMVDVDFTPRLIYLRLKEVATFPQVAQPGIHEETNVAVTLSGPNENPRPWQPLLNSRATDGSELITRQPGARATIKFWGDGFDLIMQRGPTLGRGWITIDGEKVPGLPLDVNGNSYIDLSSPNDEWQVRIPIAKNLPRRTHTVELVVAQSGDVALDGFIVTADSSPDFPIGLVVVFGGLIIISVIMFFRSWRQTRRLAKRS